MKEFHDGEVVDTWTVEFQEAPPVGEIASVTRNQRERVRHGDDREIGWRTVAANLKHRHPELTTFSEYFGDGGKDIYGFPKLVERTPERLAEWYSFQRRRRTGSAGPWKPTATDSFSLNWSPLSLGQSRWDYGRWACRVRICFL